jgi:hypothetical protein
MTVKSSTGLLRIMTRIPMRFLAFFSFIAFGVSAVPAQAKLSWFDTSSTFFLPPQVRAQLEATSQFPVFWWNFLVVELKDPKTDWGKVDEFCKLLHEVGEGTLLKTGCTQDLSQYRELLSDWSGDQMRRQDAPEPAVLKSRMQETLAKASMPLDSTLLGILRMDPLQSYQKLREMLEKRNQIRIQNEHGYFYDPGIKAVLLPIQFSFPPNESSRVKDFTDKLDERLETLPEIKIRGFLGPHAFALSNETQIHDDLHVVSITGSLFLVIQVLLAVVLGRWRLMLLVPPVLISTVVSAGLTVLIFGSIHGLTIAFGTGIIGLAMDYGLHSCFNTDWKGAWRANLYGILTTIVALVTILFSSIPLLRQLMAFSILGLITGYLVYWIPHIRYPQFFRVKPFSFVPNSSPRKLTFIFVCLIGFIIGCATVRPNFSMQQFNYTTPRNAVLMPWLVKAAGLESPLVDVYRSESPLDQASERGLWAKSNGVRVEGLSMLLPTVKEQTEHLATWKDVCDKRSSLGEADAKFFQPFWQNCDGLSPKNLRGDLIPTYLRDFHGRDGSWVALWNAETPSQKAAIKGQYPGAISLAEAVDLFPKILFSELSWMAPLSLLLATLLLWTYYRDLYLVALSLLPFFSGMGLYLLLALLFHFQISFISVVAGVMIFGLSIDYGIFATNLYAGANRPTGPGVWTALVSAALVTLFGFVPLLFCKHPILIQLGQVLVWGTLGTILGAIWGVPGIHGLLSKRRVQP